MAKLVNAFKSQLTKKCQLFSIRGHSPQSYTITATFASSKVAKGLCEWDYLGLIWKPFKTQKFLRGLKRIKDLEEPETPKRPLKTTLEDAKKPYEILENPRTPYTPQDPKGP